MVDPKAKNIDATTTIVCGRVDNGTVHRCDAWLKSAGHTRQDLVAFAVQVFAEPHLRAAVAPLLQMVAAAGYPSAMRELASAALGSAGAAPTPPKAQTAPAARTAAPVVADPLAGLNDVDRKTAEKIEDAAHLARFVAARKQKYAERAAQQATRKGGK